MGLSLLQQFRRDFIVRKGQICSVLYRNQFCVSDKTYYTLKLLISENTDTPIVFVKLSIFCILFSTSSGLLLNNDHHLQICSVTCMRLFVRHTMYVHEISCVALCVEYRRSYQQLHTSSVRPDCPETGKKGADTTLHCTNTQIHKQTNLQI